MEQLQLTTPVTFRFTAAERAAFRYMEDVATAEWAEASIEIPFGGTPGPYKSKLVPYMDAPRGPFEAFDEPNVRRIDLVFPPQSSKSLFAHICHLKKAKHRPSIAYVILGEKKGAENFSRDYVQPIMAASPGVADLLPESRASKSASRIEMTNGHKVYFGYASNMQTVQSFPGEMLICDERKDWPAGADEKARSRLRQYPYTSKEINISSVRDEKGYWTEATENEELRMHLARCPECAVLQSVVWGGKGDDDEEGHDESEPGIKFNSSIKPDVIKKKKLARYQCANEKCEYLWDEDELNWAVANGEWITVDKDAFKREHWNDPFPPLAEEADEPAAVTFILPASWYSPQVSMSEAVASFLKANSDPDPAKRKERLATWTNEHRNRPPLEKNKKIFKESTLLARLKDERPARLVPSDALCLVASADVHLDCVWFEIRAILDPVSLTSALVNYGQLIRGVWQPGPDQIDIAPDLVKYGQVIDQHYLTADGRHIAMMLNLTDSGYRTPEVYEFCRRRGRGNYPTKGEDIMPTPLAYKKIDTFPGTSTLIPGGVQLVRINTWHFKNDLHLRLQLDKEAHGAWVLHKDTHADYAKHYTAEYPDDLKKKWLVHGSQPNHLFDCGLGCRAGMEILRADGTLAKLFRDRNAQASSGNRQTQKQQVQQDGGQKRWGW